MIGGYYYFMQIVLVECVTGKICLVYLLSTSGCGAVYNIVTMFQNYLFTSGPEMLISC
jgi:hypothetical protein